MNSCAEASVIPPKSSCNQSFFLATVSLIKNYFRACVASLNQQSNSISEHSSNCKYAISIVCGHVIAWLGASEFNSHGLKKDGNVLNRLLENQFFIMCFKLYINAEVKVDKPFSIVKIM